MFNIHTFMMQLAAKRPIFHSEADFQHAFAWEFHNQYPDAIVRLEYPVLLNKWMYLDLWLETPTLKLAIELKYKTLQLEIAHNNEQFRLKNHAAQDIGRYDFFKDVVRAEAIANTREDVEAYAILLTNDASYWATGREGTVDMSFRLNHGRNVSGDLGWALHAGAGTTKDRTDILRLARSYTVDWHSFSKLPVKTRGDFRYLVFKV